MKQALHIFGKDARRLWAPIVVVAVLFAMQTVIVPGSAGFNWDNWSPLLIIVACWGLGASAVHEDAPAQESPFWLTRPYDRGSLVLAKVMFVLAFVIAPLVISGIVLELRTGVDVVAHAGTLALLCLMQGTLLILPALALGAVTWNLKSFAAGIGLVVIAENVATEFLPMADRQTIPDAPDLSVLPMVVVAIAVVAIQYRARRTRWSDALIALGVIAASVLSPMDSVRQASMNMVGGGFDSQRVRVAFDESTQPRFDESDCFSVALNVEGLPPGTGIRNSGIQKAQMSSIRTGIQQARDAVLTEEGNGYREKICGVPGVSPQWELRASLSFEVLAVQEIAKMPARSGLLRAGNSGECEIISEFPRHLQCSLAKPALGKVGAGLEYDGFKAYSQGFDLHSFRPGPVSSARFYGGSVGRPGNWPFEEAMQRPDARFVLRTERVIGYLERDLLYQNLVFPTRPVDRMLREK